MPTPTESTEPIRVPIVTIRNERRITRFMIAERRVLPRCAQSTTNANLAGSLGDAVGDRPEQSDAGETKSQQAHAADHRRYDPVLVEPRIDDLVDGAKGVQRRLRIEAVDGVAKRRYGF